MTIPIQGSIRQFLLESWHQLPGKDGTTVCFGRFLGNLGPDYFQMEKSRPQNGLDKIFAGRKADIFVALIFENEGAKIFLKNGSKSRWTGPVSIEEIEAKLNKKVANFARAFLSWPQ